MLLPIVIPWLSPVIPTSLIISHSHETFSLAISYQSADPPAISLLLAPCEVPCSALRPGSLDISEVDALLERDADINSTLLAQRNVAVGLGSSTAAGDCCGSRVG